MRFRVLGPIRVTSADGDLPLGGPKQRLVLALLLTSPGRLVTTGRLVESLWHGDPPADPRRSLQVYVSNLRGVLDEVDLDHRDGGYVLRTEPSQIDAERFAELVNEGAGLVDSDPARAAAALRDALALWRGRPFGELNNEPALAADVARLEELRLRGLEARIEADLALGLHPEVVGELRELVAEFPLRERFRAQLMVALYRSGRQAEALAVYESARNTLSEQLGIDPSPFLQDIYEQVLRQDPALATPSPEAAPGRVDTAPAIRRVRGYELLEEIGSGGFGVVYRGRQPAIDRDVAVKIIRPELANDPEFVRHFEVEAQTIARLEHLHIVPLYDYWREPDAAYLVMRWLRGGSLHRALRRGPWNLEPARRLIDQIASALDLAHRHGVVHRDVKPANVLLDAEDNAYLSDFGIARGVDDPPVSPGSVPYLTPEHVTDGPLTHATDIFNLGLVAFELLTGRHPYEGEPPESLPQRALHQPLPSLLDLRPELSGSIQQALRRATAVDPDERFETAGQFAEALRDHTAAVSARAPGPTKIRNPYKGLRAFHEADADDYYGREGLVDHLLERLDPVGRGSRFVAVVGPSGSGKSSLVRAGLIPSLRRGGVRGSERWFVTTMLPGEWPVAELERALVEVATCEADDVREALRQGEGGLISAVERALPDDGSELLLVVDQFEELFSLSRTEDRVMFARQLHRAATAASSRLRIVLTLRADFYDHPLLSPTLGELVAANTVPVATLSREELERAIVEPAAAVGVRLHWDLLTRIVDDVVDAPGGLPLLQYALTELFERRDDTTITLDGYGAIGGVHGALAGRAEELYASLDGTGQDACRQIFLRLVAVGEDSADTRRRVLRAELVGLTDDDTADHVLEIFGRHRLLTFDRDLHTRAPTVEIAHEALLDAWSRLRGWIDTARVDLVMRARLGAAADEWISSGRDDGYLLRASRLEEFDAWVPHSRLALAPGEEDLLEASRAAAEARREREWARREREQRLERRSANRLRAVAVVSLVAALVAAGLSVFAFTQRNRAQQQRAAAQLQERIATARGLASAATAQLTEDPERSILLAIEAVNTTRDSDGTVLPEAEIALRRAIRSSHVEDRLPSGSGMSLAPDGRLATLGVDGTLTVWDADSREPLLELTGQSSSPVRLESDGGQAFLANADDVDFSPDGSRIVVADADLNGAIRDASSGEVDVRLDGDLARPRFSPDGRLVAAIVVQEPETGIDAARSVGIWDAATGELVQRFDEHRANVRTHVFSPDGTLLATNTELDGTQAWDLDTGELRWSLPHSEDSPILYAIAFHPDGEHIALGTQDGAVLLQRVDDRERLATFTGHASLVRGVHFSPDGDRLLTVANDGARVWDTENGEELFVLDGHTGPVEAGAFLPDGNRVVTTSADDDTTRIWNIGVEGGFEYAARRTVPPPVSLSTEFSPDGRHLPTSDADGTVHVWDVATMEEAFTLDNEHPAHIITYSADGVAIATSAVPGYGDRPYEQWRDQADLWDATTGEHLATVTDYDTWNWDLALSPDGLTVANAGNDGLVRAVDVGTGEERFTYVHEQERAYHVAYTADGERLVVGAQDSGLILDAETGEVLHELDVGRSLFDVAFVDDDRMVAGEVGGLFRLWNLDTGEAIRTIRQESGAGGVAVWEDTVAIAGSQLVTVRDFHTGEQRFDLEYDAEVGKVRLSPDGRYLAVMTHGGHVHVHVLRTEDLLDLAYERLTRWFTDEECEEFLQAECPPPPS